jgi:hypothetical protein
MASRPKFSQARYGGLVLRKSNAILREFQLKCWEEEKPPQNFVCSSHQFSELSWRNETISRLGLELSPL